MTADGPYEIRLFEGHVDGTPVLMSVDPDRVAIQTGEGADAVVYGYQVSDGSFFVNQIPAFSHQIEEFQSWANKVASAASTGEVKVTVMIEDKE